MGMLDHWQPVLLSRRLGSKPIGVRVAGQDIVLFRGEGGQVAALEDVCPHRRTRLSCGKVVSGRLQCLYHGWTFDASGAGESPATPKLYACARSFTAVERHHAIWVKALESEPAFPELQIEGCYNVCNLQHQVNAPLELALDNFCEIEHTPTTHQFFGYPLERMHEVQVRFESTDTMVRVINRGPRKRMSLLMRALLAIGDDYEFHDDWTTYFSPVYSVYDHWWAHPTTGRESMVRWRLYIFFTPVDNDRTTVTTLAFTKSRWPGPAGAVRLFKWLMRRKLDYEIRLDAHILDSLADKSTGLEGMKLSRFDKVLGLNRERIQRIYRGLPDGAVG
jgi:phenylpropionate dioxygenase-like ring-hydroxylating dioxygenase large terminal subunit